MLGVCVCGYYHHIADPFAVLKVGKEGWETAGASHQQWTNGALTGGPAGRAKGTAISSLVLNKWSVPGVHEMKAEVCHRRGKAETRPRAERQLSPLKAV